MPLKNGLLLLVDVALNAPGIASGLIPFGKMLIGTLSHVVYVCDTPS